MLRINPTALTAIARENDWLHTTGRLTGTVNASKMAIGLGVAKSTITRAYDGGAAGMVLLEKLAEISDLPLDLIVERASA